MNHSFTLHLDARLVVQIEDTDPATIARALRRLSGYAEIVERFGVDTARRMIRHDGVLKKILFVEAQGGHAMGSTIVM